MASKRDLVEANSFNRRRLVTAFVSGAPRGREVEPQAPARVIVAGFVLALLVVGGSALAGALKPTLPTTWGEERLVVVSKETGARYLVHEGTLFPVANTASARLLLESETFEVAFAPESELAKKPRGVAIGIVGGPDSLPPPDRLVQSGWTSCLDQQGDTKVTVGADLAVTPAPGSAAAVVVTRGAAHVVVDGRRHRIEGDADDALAVLDLSSAEPLAAPPAWLDLFPAGSPIEPVEVPEAGEPIPSSWQNVPGAVHALGSVLEVRSDSGSKQRYLLRADGRVPLSEVGFAMYQVSQNDLADPIVVERGDIVGIPAANDADAYPDDWPEELPQPLDDPVACARLDSASDQDRPEVSLVIPKASLASSESPGGVAPTARGASVVVEPGAGAVVRAAGGTPTKALGGSLFLVDSAGRRYAFAGDDERRFLGYGAVSPASVPPAWVNLFESGPELSVAAASSPVETSKGRS